MFQNLRQGNTLYVLEKGKTPELRIAQVTNVSQQMPRYNTTPTVGIGLNADMVVDVKAKAGEQDYEFKQLSCNKSVESYGNAVVSDNREAMLSEVDAMRQMSQQIIDSVDYHKKVIEATTDMLKTLNPNFAKEQERDEAIKDLYRKMDSFGATLGNIEKLLSKERNK